VNEGWIEWPPSPWRVLRALIATGFTKLHWVTIPDPARSLIEMLADTLPEYVLPRAGTGHTRHYMPLASIDKGREKTTLVFDSWADVGKGQLAIRWNVILPEEQTQLLRNLVESMSYLGRAESWVAGSLADDSWSPPPDSLRAYPCEGSNRPGAGWEQVALLAPEPANEYSRWRESQMACMPQVTEKPKKKGKKKSTKHESDIPEDLIACLLVDTTWLEASGWNQAPGSRKALYWRPFRALEPGAPLRRRAMHNAPPVEAMLLALSTPSGNMHALPPITRVLPQAELLHRSLVSHIARLSPSHHGTLTGKSENGSPRRGHSHVHLLALDLDSDGHLDHFLLWAPAGLEAACQEAVRATRKTYMKGGVGELQLAISGAGSLGDLRTAPGPEGKNLLQSIGVSPVWTSATPLVLPRHLKSKGRHTLEGQIQEELASRGLPPATSIEILSQQQDFLRRFPHFVRVRRSGPPPPADQGYALSLSFDQPIAGPLCLGYGSHFGLGRFVTSSPPPS